MDVVRAQALSSIQGIAPDGTDVNLIVHEASRGHSGLGETGLRAHGPQWVPGPLLMKSYVNWPVRLENQPCLTVSIMSSCSCALLGSQWTVNAVATQANTS